MAENTKNCPYCDEWYNATALFCPKCGNTPPSDRPDDEGEKDPYKILQVSPYAELEVIQAAYKSLVNKYHPDASGKNEAEDRIKEIQWAYRTLSDPKRKKDWFERKAGEEKGKKAFSPVEDIYKKSRKSQGVLDDGKGGCLLKLLIAFCLALFIPFSIFFIYASSNYSTLFFPPSPTGTPAPARTVKPASTRSAAPTHLHGQLTATGNSSASSNCRLWSTISLSDVGKTLCVYGTVAALPSEWIVRNNQQIPVNYLKFNAAGGSFYILYYDTFYFLDNEKNRPLAVGDCVYTTDEIEKLDDIPVMVFTPANKLYKCE